MYDQIRKKWIYNFIVSPKTNLIEKPEWCLNYSLKIIHDNIDEIEAKSKINPSQKNGVNAKEEFILSMLELIMTRLERDIKTISSSGNKKDEILVHIYNEVIQFTKIIKQLLGDSFSHLQDRHDLLSVFSNQNLFEKIVDIEWNCAEKNLEAITQSANRWERILQDDFVDLYKVPKCVDSFLMLINSITERVECFQQLDCQFKLIELQCYLFKKFLTFLKMSASKSSEASSSSLIIISEIFSGLSTDYSTCDTSSRVPMIINGISFLKLVLREHCFIPKQLIENLDPTLLDQANELASNYRDFYHELLQTYNENKDNFSRTVVS